jgi:hypothetical protein
MGHAECTEKINAYNTLDGEPERNRPLERSRQTWEDNIGIDLRETDWEDVHLAQDRDQWRAVVNTAMIFRIS